MKLTLLKYRGTGKHQGCDSLMRRNLCIRCIRRVVCVKFEVGRWEYEGVYLDKNKDLYVSMYRMSETRSLSSFIRKGKTINEI